jgi:hypothetical protein
MTITNLNSTRIIKRRISRHSVHVYHFSVFRMFIKLAEYLMNLKINYDTYKLAGIF